MDALVLPPFTAHFQSLGLPNQLIYFSFLHALDRVFFSLFSTVVLVSLSYLLFFSLFVEGILFSTGGSDSRVSSTAPLFRPLIGV
jgi:hypothetical protein